MSEKSLSILEQTLVDTINATKQGITAGIDFASNQIPDVIQQLLMWKLAENILFAFVFVLCIIFYLVVMTKAWNIYQAKSERERNEGFLVLFGAFGGVFLFIMPAIALVVHLKEILQITIAPKIYLIEYVSNLIK